MCQNGSPRNTDGAESPELVWQGWLLAEHGKMKEGIAQMLQAQDKIGAGETEYRYFLHLRAIAYGEAG